MRILERLYHCLSKFDKSVFVNLKPFFLALSGLVFYLEAIGVKGQLISECIFEKIVWTKIPTKNLIDSAQQRLLLQG